MKKVCVSQANVDKQPCAVGHHSRSDEALRSCTRHRWCPKIFQAVAASILLPLLFLAAHPVLNLGVEFPSETASIVLQPHTWFNHAL